MMKVTRRRALRWLCALPAAGLLSARPEARTEAPERRFILNLFAIAGFQYYAGPQLVRGMRAGEELTLAAAPENPSDAFAVRIERQGVKLGYVPRTDNRHLSRLLHQGAHLDCRVVEVRAEGSPWRMVKVEVGMEV